MLTRTIFIAFLILNEILFRFFLKHDCILRLSLNLCCCFFFSDSIALITNLIICFSSVRHVLLMRESKTLEWRVGWAWSNSLLRHVIAVTTLLKMFQCISIKKHIFQWFHVFIYLFILEILRMIHCYRKYSYNQKNTAKTNKQTTKTSFLFYSIILSTLCG